MAHWLGMACQARHDDAADDRAAREGRPRAKLDVLPGTPGLVVERVAWSDGRRIEFTRSLMRADRYRIVVHLRRGAAASGVGRRHTRAAAASV